MRTVDDIDADLREAGNEVTILRAARNAALHQADEARRRLVTTHDRINTLIDERTLSTRENLVARLLGPG